MRQPRWCWSAARATTRRKRPASCAHACGPSSTTSSSAGVRASCALDHLEGAAGDALELIEVLVVPAAVAAAAEVPVGAVVGDDQAVALHRFGDHLGAAAEAAETVAGLEPPPRPHR